MILGYVFLFTGIALSVVGMVLGYAYDKEALSIWLMVIGLVFIISSATVLSYIYDRERAKLLFEICMQIEQMP